MDYDEQIEKIITESYNALPKRVKNIIYGSSWKNIVNRLVQANNLTDEQRIVIEDELFLVSVGLKSASNFIESIMTEGKIPQEIASQIGVELDRNILEEIRQVMSGKTGGEVPNDGNNYENTEEINESNKAEGGFRRPRSLHPNKDPYKEDIEDVSPFLVPDSEMNSTSDEDSGEMLEEKMPEEAEVENRININKGQNLQPKTYQTLNQDGMHAEIRPATGSITAPTPKTTEPTTDNESVRKQNVVSPAPPTPPAPQMSPTSPTPPTPPKAPQAPGTPQGKFQAPAIKNPYQTQVASENKQSYQIGTKPPSSDEIDRDNLLKQIQDPDGDTNEEDVEELSLEREMAEQKRQEVMRSPYSTADKNVPSPSQKEEVDFGQIKSLGDIREKMQQKENAPNLPSVSAPNVSDSKIPEPKVPETNIPKPEAPKPETPKENEMQIGTVSQSQPAPQEKFAPKEPKQTMSPSNLPTGHLNDVSEFSADNLNPNKAKTGNGAPPKKSYSNDPYREPIE